jgi:hypothetical protein
MPPDAGSSQNMAEEQPQGLHMPDMPFIEHDGAEQTDDQLCDKRHANHKTGPRQG